LEEVAMTTQRLTMFVDTGCSVCAREARVLRKLDRRGRIAFVDIAAPEFDGAVFGRSQRDLSATMHVRLEDGTWATGVEAFRKLYGAVGFGPLVMISRLPVVSQLLDRAYTVFARNRVRWFGGCDGDSCAVPRSPRVSAAA
jgi:predicted DCC family thiol-disulfide oxidoreductase YuxK